MNTPWNLEEMKSKARQAVADGADCSFKFDRIPDLRGNVRLVIMLAGHQDPVALEAPPAAVRRVLFNGLRTAPPSAVDDLLPHVDWAIEELQRRRELLSSDDDDNDNGPRAA